MKKIVLYLLVTCACVSCTSVRNATMTFIVDIPESDAIVYIVEGAHLESLFKKEICINGYTEDSYSWITNRDFVLENTGVLYNVDSLRQVSNENNDICRGRIKLFSEYAKGDEPTSKMVCTTIDVNRPVLYTYKALNLLDGVRLVRIVLSDGHTSFDFNVLLWNDGRKSFSVTKTIV